ncbi:MAG: hypothetical protein JXL97_15615 [Bacteroidales bacterium]|nr:hypothetical protein [Bacteroidales bacterium]
MRAIEINDTVRHRTDKKHYTGEIVVISIDGNKILCEYFDSSDNCKKEKWFDENELEFVKSAEGVFF